MQIWLWNEKQKEGDQKRHDPLAYCTHQLTLEDIACALQDICEESDCLLYSVILKKAVLKDTESSVLNNPISLEDKLHKVTNDTEVLQGISKFTEQNIQQIELITRGQTDNMLWLAYRKNAITASKAHNVMTRYASLRRSDNYSDEFRAIFTKVSERSIVNPELPALKYGRSVEEEAVRSFTDDFSKAHRNVKVLMCGLSMFRSTFHTYCNSLSIVIYIYIYTITLEKLKQDRRQLRRAFTKTSNEVTSLLTEESYTVEEICQLQSTFEELSTQFKECKDLDKDIRKVVMEEIRMEEIRMSLWRNLFAGMGVFATKRFSKGDFLLHYSGELVTRKKGEERETVYGDSERSYMYFFSHNGKELW